MQNVIDVSALLQTPEESLISPNTGNGHPASATEQKPLDEALRESERRFRQMVDLLPAAIYTTDAEGRLTYFNAAAVEFSGRVPELGTNHWCISWKLYNPDGTPLPHDKCPMAIALKEGRAIRGMEAIAERPDGKRIWFTPYPTPLFDKQGKVVGGINMLVDITERKEAEEMRNRLAAIVESSDDAIISKRLDGVIVSWNSGAERIFGYTAQEAVGRSVTMLIPPERLDEEATILDRLKHGKRIDHFETVRVRKDGTRLDISLTVSPVRDSAGRIIGASKTARDITERKKAERELEDAHQQLRGYATELETRVAARTAELRATNEQLEAFVYSIAHDLRAPLRSMTGYAQLLIDDHATGLKDTGQQMLKRIQASSEFMDRLLLDLLAYGRVARAEIDIGRVEVRKVWDTALTQCASEIEKTGAQVEVAGGFPVVKANEPTLAQCVGNLLSNALKFVAPGVRPRVRFAAEEISEGMQPARVRLWIQDNGIGIPKDQQERIFRVFERLDGGRYSGTGVGLSIVRKGVERMGGKVGLVSEAGHGSRFWIELAKA